VIDLLVRHIRESLTPSEIAVALFQQAETIDFVLGWPPGRSNPRPLLELAARRGPLLIQDGPEALLREAGLPISDGRKLAHCTVHRQNQSNRSRSCSR
jgi:hypothetical protein